MDDRNRLQQVQQTDLTESKVNTDFIDWLKNKGLTYMLVILVVLVGYVFWIRWGESRQIAQSAAYWDLDEATQPESLEAVASEHAGVGSVPELAKLRAADLYRLSAMMGYDQSAPDTELTEEEIDSRRSKARQFYADVAEAAEGDPSKRLLGIQAHFGLAALAESEDAPDIDAARTHYQKIVELAAEWYKPLAAQAEARLDSLDKIAAFAGLPRREDLPTGPLFDPLLEDIFEENAVLEDESQS